MDEATSSEVHAESERSIFVVDRKTLKLDTSVTFIFEFSRMQNYRIRLSTLLWIVTSACCFTAGHQWHRRDAIMASVSEIIVLGDGQYHLLTMSERIPKIDVMDPAIANVDPLSPTELLIRGSQPGVTNMVVSTEDGKVTSFQINVLGPTSVVVKKAKR